MFLSLYVFDTNLLNFYSFLKVVWCCHLSYLLFYYHYFVFCSSSKNHCMLAKREKLKEKMYENQKQTKKTKKNKKCWGYPKHLFELLVMAIACVQKYIFYEKKAKTKKFILTPCAIKLSFIRHGFCHSQEVCLHIIWKCLNWHTHWINR